MTSGLYTITNTVTGDYYLGSALRLVNRWQQHRYLPSADSGYDAGRSNSRAT